MIVYQATGVSFDFDDDTKILVQNWKGFTSSEQFRAAIDKTVELVKQKSVKAILNNTLEHGVVKPADTEYASATMPKLFMNGLKGMAIIIPKNVFSKMSVEKFEQDSKGADVRMFTDVNSAMDWIKTII